MQREYQDGSKNNVTLFTGIEVEKTPAYGKKTLFVVGMHTAKDLSDLAKENDCDHIYLGANHSYTASNYAELSNWELMSKKLLEDGFYVTLDMDIFYYNDSLDLIAYLCESNKFILQVSVKLPYVSNLNYNTCIKIDDKNFDSTNPGVWVHQLHDLMDRSKFNDWSVYGQDNIIK
jgi:hypothetical protein